MFLGLLVALTVTAPAHALREVIVGNEPLSPGFGFGKEFLAAVNIEERVYLEDHNGNLSIYFKGGPKALNEMIRKFTAIPANGHEIILLPVPAKPLSFGKKPIPYDWWLHVPIAEPFRGEPADTKTPTGLTIYIPEHLRRRRTIRGRRKLGSRISAATTSRFASTRPRSWPISGQRSRRCFWTH